MPQHPGRVNLQVRFPDLQCGASLAEATTEIPLPPAVSISTQPFCDSLFGTELDTHTHKFLVQVKGCHDFVVASRVNRTGVFIFPSLSSCY